MDQLLTLLQWLVPTGGLGALLGWLTNSRVRAARTAKEVHDTYKQMYDDVHDQLLNLSDENKHIRADISRLERAVTMGATCRIWSQCPIRRELQRSPLPDVSVPSHRQRQRKGRDPTNARSSARDEGDTSPPSLDPP